MAIPINKTGGTLALAGAALLAALTQWEGVINRPYRDIVGVHTVCVGHTGADIENRIYTDAECKSLLAGDVAKHGAAVLKCVNVAIKQNEYDAFAMFAFNVGEGAFCGSTLLKKFNAGDKKGACDGLLAWDMAGGKHIPGLAARRRFERDLCLGTNATKA